MQQPSLRRAAALAICLLASPTFAQVQWRTGPGAIPTKASKGDLVELLTSLQARPSQKHVVAHFAAPLTDAQKTALAAAGLRLLDYVGANAYFAALDNTLRPAAAADAGVLVTVEPINDIWKLHPDLAAGIVRSWVIVNQPKGQELPANAAVTRNELAAQGRDPTVAVTLVLHADAAAAEARPIVQRLGGRVVYEYQTMRALDIEAPLSAIDALASEDIVRYIEPAMPALTTCNSSNRARTGVNIVNTAPYDLDGSGIDILVYDGGTISNHIGLAGRVTTGDASGPIPHATHVAGTIGGTGAGSPNNIHRGMAPGVRFISYGVQGFSQEFFRNMPGDTEADYLAAIAQGADVANNSVSSNIESNGMPCIFQGDYGVFNEMLDSLIRGERNAQNGAPFRTIWAAGNERQGNACAIEGFGDFYSVPPPQAGKNQICVGAVNSNDDSITSFTTWGPTDDGRLKPDFCAPGCQSDDDGGVTSSVGAGSYEAFCGTSMASPTATGIAALFLQDWGRLYPGAPDPLNSTIKAIFANTAVDLDDPGPDYKSGYGSIRAPAIIDALRAGDFLESQVSQGQVDRFVVVVPPGETQLRVMLAWDDFRGVANVNPNLVNDLDLVVTSPSGARHHVWTLNPLNPDAPALQTQEDHLNNIEQVLVNNPQPGGWVVEIRGTNVPQGPQRFSAASSSRLVNCSNAGVPSIGAPVFNCAAPGAPLQVIDCGLNTSDSVIDTVAVLVRSTSEPAGEVVVLTEIAASAAAFAGAVPLGLTDAPGVLRIAPGDTITLVYLDADDGSGGSNTVTATATVDCTPPAITNVSVTNVTPHTATITFTTSEPAQSTVRWGASCANLTSAIENTHAATLHSMNLTKLQPGATYVFAVEAVDAADNHTVNDNAGACFTFGTPEVPTFFTEQFEADNDLDNKSIRFVPDGSSSFYTACIESITALPTDPAPGTRITFPGTQDDQFVELTVAGGATVSLYGQTYTSLFVGTNGYITLTAGDRERDETLAGHFRLPRIAPLFDDLNPGNGGDVRWRQLADRFVVAWINIPEYPNTGRNTFEVELFFDGEIHVSWLAISARDAIAGLSPGGGLNPAFVETDLSALRSTCEPPCRCDWSHDNILSSQDFFDFLTDFFAERADFNSDGRTNTQDFFDFLACFFVGC